jgi:hypothetical protein
MNIDLNSFCELTDESPREELRQPFSRGDFTYATNGHIMVRVPRRIDVSRDVVLKVDPETILAGINETKFRPLPNVTLPDDSTVACPSCNGSKHEHRCPDCKCKCEYCDGAGLVTEEISVSIGKAPFALRYVRMLIELPKIEVAKRVKLKPATPILFRFDGGVGALMPMRSRGERHITTFDQQAA